MSVPATIADAIEENAKGPQSVSADGVSVSARPIDEQIKADQYLTGKEAATKAHRGLRFTKLIPPGGG